jgi:hypothetical protein
MLDDEELEILVGLLMRTAARTCGATPAQTA